MCIAIYKPAGVELPKKKRLKACDESNPDYSGYMIAINGTVLIRKGFKGVKRLRKSIAETERIHEINAKDYAMVLHFRIATSGLVKPQNAHPFPLSSSVRKLQELKISCETGMAHNGIFFGINAKDNLSDTQLMIKNTLSKYSFDKIKRKRKSLETLFLGNKVVFLHKTGEAEVFGSWIKDDGAYYSNSSYIPYRGYNYKWERTDTGYKYRSYNNLVDFPKNSEGYWFEDDKIYELDYDAEGEASSYKECVLCGQWVHEKEMINDHCEQCLDYLSKGPDIFES